VSGLNRYQDSVHVSFHSCLDLFPVRFVADCTSACEFWFDIRYYQELCQTSEERKLWQVSVFICLKLFD
jgi:hypothetical protein